MYLEKNSEFPIFANQERGNFFPNFVANSNSVSIYELNYHNLIVENIMKKK